MAKIKQRKEGLEYSLPEERIALHPAKPRDSSRLMVVKMPDFEIEDRVFTDIPCFIEKGTAVAVNNSKVIKARIKGKKETGGRAEFLILEKQSDSWVALGRPYSRLRKNSEITVFSSEGGKTKLVIEEKLGRGKFLLRCPEDITDFGYMPLPPYITKKRKIKKEDFYSYQPIFASEKGSVAASTATLHFTENVSSKIVNKGGVIVPITLHIGPGTFRPTGEAPEPERYMVTSQSADILNKSRKICVCGTTVMRTLETVYKNGRFSSSSGITDLYIKPGYEFKTPTMFLTNFHLPGSSLLKMVAGYIEQFFPGQGARRLKYLYNRAIENEYRFLSYGDAMLLIDQRKKK